MNKRKTLAERLAAMSMFDPKTGCVLWLGHRGPTGYGAIGYNGKVIRAHRAAYMLAHGPIPDGMCICHKCDEPSCVNVDHLFLATHAENMADMAKKGRANPSAAIAAAKLCRRRGETHGCAKLTAASVISMRGMYQDGWTLKRLAEEWRVSFATVQSAIRGTTWAHVPGALPNKYTRKPRQQHGV